MLELTLTSSNSFRPLPWLLSTAGFLGSSIPVVSMSGNDSSAGNMSFAMGAALAGAGLLVGLAGPKFVAKIMTKLKPGGTFNKVRTVFCVTTTTIIVAIVYSHSAAAIPGCGLLNEGIKKHEAHI